MNKVKKHSGLKMNKANLKKVKNRVKNNKVRSRSSKMIKIFKMDSLKKDKMVSKMNNLRVHKSWSL
jgi:hypothetical protein